MKTIIATIALSFAFSAHAGTIGGGPHGGMSTGAASPGMLGMHSGGPSSMGSQTGAGSSEGGNGGYYYGPRDGSVVDNYQPWPEAEMRKFQKP